MEYYKLLTSILFAGGLTLGLIGYLTSKVEETSIPRPIASIPTCGIIVGVATGDMDGDKRLDAIVASNNGYNELNVYLNENLGNNQFQTRKIGSVPTMSMYATVATGDMNGDRRLDAIVASNNEPGKAYVYVLLNNGDGTFSTRKIGSVPTMSMYATVATGDMDGDMRLDAIVASYNEPGKADVYALLNNGDGTFSNNE